MHWDNNFAIIGKAAPPPACRTIDEQESTKFIEHVDCKTCLLLFVQEYEKQMDLHRKIEQFLDFCCETERYSIVESLVDKYGENYKGE